MGNSQTVAIPLTQQELLDKGLIEIQKMQFSPDHGQAQVYAFVEKTVYGTCILDESEEIKDTFELNMYLTDPSITIGHEHPIWDKYNLLAIQHVEELNFPEKGLRAIARKMAVIRARILQCGITDEHSKRDFHTYDFLIDNWSEDITIDILQLHRYKEEDTFRIMESRVLQWILSKMVCRPPPFYKLFDQTSP